MSTHLRTLLDEAYDQYNAHSFIDSDPVSIPHRFTKKQDIEIMGLWAAVLAWGKRSTIIQKCDTLISLMEHQPHTFVLEHQESDLKRFLSFKHRTFMPTDALYFMAFLKEYYQQHDSLEYAFSEAISAEDHSVEQGLIHFHRRFFNSPYAPVRTRKHIATPERKSACKRLNMYLRWMVRQGDVDFGLWNNIKPSQLVCPLDVHVERVARSLGLLHRKQTDWKAAIELTDNLKEICAEDPVKYDIALFGLGVNGHYQ